MADVPPWEVENAQKWENRPRKDFWAFKKLNSGTRLSYAEIKIDVHLV